MARMYELLVCQWITSSGQDAGKAEGHVGGLISSSPSLNLPSLLRTHMAQREIMKNNQVQSANGYLLLARRQTDYGKVAFVSTFSASSTPAVLILVALPSCLTCKGGRG